MNVRHRHFGPPFSSRHKALSTRKKGVLKCMQNGCPHFGARSALRCALGERFLARSKTGLAKIQILGCFLTRKCAKLAAPFLDQKMTNWVRSLSVKKIKTRLYFAAKNPHPEKPLETPFAPYLALWQVLIFTAKRSAVAHPRSMTAPVQAPFHPCLRREKLPIWPSWSLQGNPKIGEGTMKNWNCLGLDRLGSLFGVGTAHLGLPCNDQLGQMGSFSRRRQG